MTVSVDHLTTDVIAEPEPSAARGATPPKSQKTLVEPVVIGDLGVERRSEKRPLLHRDDPAVGQ